LLLDPGATLAPARYGLPPSEEEWEALRRANDRISAYAARARYIFLSHYHEDHFRSDPVNYAGRTVLAKDPRRMVTGVQSRRAQALWAALDGHAVIQAADSVTLTTRDLDLSVSPPLPHGFEGTAMGYVVALTVTDHHEHQRFVFASDVQGPLSPVAAAWLIQARPTTLYLSGPTSRGATGTRRLRSESRMPTWPGGRTRPPPRCPTRWSTRSRSAVRVSICASGSPSGRRRAPRR
jgi:uncharacterized protein